MGKGFDLDNAEGLDIVELMENGFKRKVIIESNEEFIVVDFVIIQYIDKLQFFDRILTFASRLSSTMQYQLS